MHYFYLTDFIFYDIICDNFGVFVMANENGKNYKNLLEIDLREALEVCYIDDSECSAYGDYCIDSRKTIYDIFGVLRFGDDFNRFAFVKSDGVDLWNQLNVSPRGFTNAMCKDLGFKFNGDYSDFVKVFDLYVKSLNSFSNSIKALEKFPTLLSLYNILCERNNNNFKSSYLSSILARFNLSDGSTITTDTSDNTEYLKRCGLSSNPNAFLQYLKKAYGSYNSNLRAYFKHISDNPIQAYKFRNFDYDKFDLYLAYKYIFEFNSCDNESKKRTIKGVLDNYFAKKGNNSRIIVNGKCYTFESLKQLYSTIISQELSFKGITIEGDICPEGDDINPDNVINDDCKRRVIRADEDSMYEEKKRFYSNTGCILRLNSNSTCYSAFVYPNGQILCDTLPEGKNKAECVGNAIYNFNIRNFERLCGLSKSDLIFKHHDVQRIFHGVHWMENAQSIIDSKSDISPSEVDTFVKRMLKRMVI